jgi:hypothetical protein
MENNPYQSPKQQSHPAADKPASPILAKTAIMFIYHLILIAVIGLALIFVVPRFDIMFIEFEVKLPAPTMLILALSRFAVNHWYLAILIPPLYFLFLLGIQSADRSFAGVALIWPLLFWLAGSAFVALMIFALASPLLALMDSLSK